MSDAELTRKMVGEIEALKREVRRLSANKPLFEILNTSPLTNISGTNNNYDPGYSDVLVFNVTAAATITGFSGGVVGRKLFVCSSPGGSSFSLTLSFGSASSIVTNRILTPSAADLVLTDRDSAILLYITVAAGTNRWMVVSAS